MPNTQEDAFLKAIVEAPDDDTPRLVYADWLEEHGDPDRAEFIRVQVELARPAPPRTRAPQGPGAADAAEALPGARQLRAQLLLAASPDGTAG